MKFTLRRVGAVALVVAGLTQLSGGELTIDGAPEEARVSVIRRVELDYYLVRPGAQLEFSVSGPAWLRVYHRLWWPVGAGGSLDYGLSLWQGESERPMQFSTSVSSSSYGPLGSRVGRWRSFYIQVSEGAHRYRLESLDRTVGVRFAFQAPREWLPVALPGAEPITFNRGTDSLGYQAVPVGHEFDLDVEGPCRVRVGTRLNYEPGLVGAQNFVLGVVEGERQIVRRNLRVDRSTAGSYVERPDLVPSTERRIRFSLGSGRHRLRLQVSGTLASSAAVRIARQPHEKYE